MTLLLTESCEFSSASDGKAPAEKWTLANDMGFRTSGPRTGSRCLTAKRDEQKAQVAAAGEHATMIVGFAYRASFTVGTGTGGSGRFVGFYSDSGATAHVTIFHDGSNPGGALGKLTAYRGDPSGAGGTLLGATADNVITPNVWNYVEVKVVLHDTAGSVVIRVDETVVLSLTGIDTKNGGTKTVLDSVGIQGVVSSTSALDDFDDIYVCNGAGSANNDFLGAVKIEALRPNGNGNSAGMTNSAGNSTNNYTYVDDTFPNPDTTDYVEGDTGKKDTYTFGDSAQPTANAVNGVVVYAYAEKTDAGARGLDAVARSGSSESTQALAALVNGTYKLGWGIFETKPGGGSWTVSDVNGAEFGYAAS